VSRDASSSSSCQMGCSSAQALDKMSFQSNTRVATELDKHNILLSRYSGRLKNEPTNAYSSLGNRRNSLGQAAKPALVGLGRNVTWSYSNVIQSDPAAEVAADGGLYCCIGYRDIRQECHNKCLQIIPISANDDEK
jgi:hypothetical protein